MAYPNMFHFQCSEIALQAMRYVSHLFTLPDFFELEHSYLRVAPRLASFSKQ